MSRGRGVFDVVNAADLAGVQFSAAEFDSLIATHGNSGELRRSVSCPCRRIDTRMPDVSCDHCHGLGWIYPPTLREPMIWLDTQRSAQAKIEGAGDLVDGTAQFTFPSGVVPARGDMMIPDGEEHVVTEYLYRDGTRRTPDALLRPYRSSADQVKPAQVGRRERLLYPVPCCVEFVAYIRPSDRGLAQANPTEYQIDNDGRWTWRGEAGPEPGEAWTVRYRAPAVYVIGKALPRFRHQHDQRMPHMVTAKRLDIVSSEDLRQ